MLTPASAHKLQTEASCHAWSRDTTLLAICSNTPVVDLYEIRDAGTASEALVHHASLVENHDQVVAAMDWSLSGLLVTCSHDRNTFVWKRQEGSDKWQPQLVLTRLQRAALCVSWAPCDTKFAIGSGAKNCVVCTYEADNSWWVGRLIRKQHDSSLLCLAWHPQAVWLVTGSSDRKCRIFHADLGTTDAASTSGQQPPEAARRPKFGELLYTVDLGAWVHDVSWHEGGRVFAAATHGSCVHFVCPFEAGTLPGDCRGVPIACSSDAGTLSSDYRGLPTFARSSDGDVFAATRRGSRVQLPSLPARSIAFLNASTLAAAGWDAVVYVVQRSGACEGAEGWALNSHVGDRLIDQHPLDTHGIEHGGSVPTHRQNRGDVAGASSKHAAGIIEICKRSKLGGDPVISTLGENGQLVSWRWNDVSRTM